MMMMAKSKGGKSGRTKKQREKEERRETLEIFFDFTETSFEHGF
jgi:hypothetical protein